MSRTLKPIDRVTVRQIAPDEWLYEVQCAADDKFPVEHFAARVRGSRADAKDVAGLRLKARREERTAERQAAAGKRGGDKKKQATEAAWALKTRALRNKGMKAMQAAEAAAKETGFKLQSSPKGVSNQLRKAEREAAAASVDPVAHAQLIRDRMDKFKRARDAFLST